MSRPGIGLGVLLVTGSTTGEFESSDEDSGPNEELLEPTDEDVKSDTVGVVVVEDVDTGTLKLSVSLEFLLLISGLIICGFSIKTIMQYDSNKHNHNKSVYLKYGSDEWTRTTDPRLMSPVL